MTPAGRPAVLAFATLGHGSTDEARLLELLAAHAPAVFPFDRGRKRAMFWQLLGRLRRDRPALAVMEGTGLAGGAALIVARLVYGQRYVVSSGDAVGPWVASRVGVLGPVFGLYERVLCRLAAGFIGWSPYLAGRALTFGTPRVMTAAGWPPFLKSAAEQAADRERTRAALGLPPGRLVVGIVGSLAWSRRRRYCYGLELVRAAARVRRRDVTYLIVGDGAGMPVLKAEVEKLPHPAAVVFTGRLPQDRLPEYYAAMDVASLPQSVDRVGGFRYTTKLSEYLGYGLPVVTGQIPLAYDLDGGWLWRLPGAAPWTPGYAAALAALLDRLTPAELAARRAAVPRDLPEFDRRRQVERAAGFVADLLAEARP